MQNKGHAMSWGKYSCQAKSPFPKLWTCQACKFTETHRNYSQKKKIIFLFEFRQELFSICRAEKTQEECVCLNLCRVGLAVHLTAIPLCWIPQPDELSPNMPLLQLHFMFPWFYILLFVTDVIFLRLAVNVITLPTASRCVCGMRTMTSNRGWSNISSASQMISWARPSSRFALSAERWTCGTI